MIELSRRSRGCITLLFFLLLLGMQQETLRHALSHFKPVQEQQELSAPADGSCLECALLSAGSSPLPFGTPVLCPSPGAHVVILPAHLAPTLARFTPNRSRAPPALS